MDTLLQLMFYTLFSYVLLIRASLGAVPLSGLLPQATNRLVRYSRLATGLFSAASAVAIVAFVVVLHHTPDNPYELLLLTFALLLDAGFVSGVALAYVGVFYQLHRPAAVR